MVPPTCVLVLRGRPARAEPDQARGPARRGRGGRRRAGVRDREGRGLAARQAGHEPARLRRRGRAREDGRADDPRQDRAGAHGPHAPGVRPGLLRLRVQPGHRPARDRAVPGRGRPPHLHPLHRAPQLRPRLHRVDPRRHHDVRRRALAPDRGQARAAERVVRGAARLPSHALDQGPGQGRADAPEAGGAPGRGPHRDRRRIAADRRRGALAPRPADHHGRRADPTGADAGPHVRAARADEVRRLRGVDGRADAQGQGQAVPLLPLPLRLRSAERPARATGATSVPSTWRTGSGAR